MNARTVRHQLLLGGIAAAALLGLGLLGCSGGGSTDATATVTVSGDVPIVYTKRAESINLRTVDGAPFAPGGDLILREKSSPSAPEHNLTAQFTQGVGDASDPEVSYDGKKIIFSLNCPTSNTATVTVNDAPAPACTGRWNIWEYDISVGGVSGDAKAFRRLTSSTTDDDVDPVYLPGNKGFIFSSNRQTKSHLNQALNMSYYALDEYERQRVFNLHSMNASGGAITQISFNQSHDRNPTIRPNGDVMFSRWDHVGGRNQFTIFRMKPDGTDLFVLYGAHSDGNSFLDPRDMDPAGAYKGQLSSDLMPLLRTSEGGALMLIDAANYSEQNTPVKTGVAAIGGQTQVTAQELNIDRGFSRYGRVSTPYPLWDGTDRILVAYHPCEVTKNDVVVSCATLSEAEIAALSDTQRTAEQLAAATVKDNVPAHYAIYMYDPVLKTMLIVAAPPAGYIYLDPVAVQARAEPQSVAPALLDETLAAQNQGLVEVRSVYDTDALGRMGDPVLTASDLAAGCTTAIPKIKPTDPNDTRPLVADLVRMKNPADPAYGCAPARFVRVVRAVAPPSNVLGLRKAIGETSFEPQQILGYAPIEPDGSFKLLVPADTPIAVSLIDAQGRAYQTHTNWIQVRPGERRTCDGCHSLRRGAALNTGAVVNTLPAALLSIPLLSTESDPTKAGPHMAGETMASTRTRNNPSALLLSADPLFQDVWADVSQSGIKARAAISLRYTGNAAAADGSSNDLPAGAVPSNGIINYPDHIQPLWNRDRGSKTCTRCHTTGGVLDLSATVGGTGRMNSYDALLIGAPDVDTATGLPKFNLVDGVPEIIRLPALVDTAANQGEALGLARKSRLMEIMSGQSLMSGAEDRLIHPAPPGSAPDHSTMLNAAEKRLLAEWMDTGAKYYNNPFDANSGVRTVNVLNQDNFNAQVQPILRSTCSNACHQGSGSTAGKNFGSDNRYVLTGNSDGDFAATLAMINNTCVPANNPLLQHPSTIPHPAAANGQTKAVLPVGSANYTAIANWIASGCPTP